MLTICIALTYTLGYSQNYFIDESLNSELSSNFEFLFQKNASRNNVNVSAIVIPNSQESFSARDAVKVYGYLNGNSYKNILFLSSGNTSFMTEDNNYSSSVGVIPINQKKADDLSKKIKILKRENNIDEMKLLNNHLPFIKFICTDNISIVPIFIDRNEITQGLVSDLLEEMNDRETLYVITEDIAKFVRFSDDFDIVTFNGKTNNANNWKVIIRK
ncbi:MAG: AmmeMemoRadiSam system protein B [Bacteroidetes bacterium GWF2_33_38]|nr:MAG: AmmeMemoRadiSam system protein B [Bacteroidetes bacterium GWF2_33_38]OFY90144.1 MAG: AmmeMemoRadiSam system protein B [Bacteroidetes bacterium RIFOXYA2_FULL_33_7]